MEGLPPPPSPPHGVSDGWDVERQDGAFFLTSLVAPVAAAAIRRDEGLATQDDTDQCVYGEVIPASCQKFPFSFLLTFSNATVPGPIRH